MKKLLLFSLLLFLTNLNAQVCFHLPQPYSIGQGPKVIRNADFDKNGIPDLVTANSYTPSSSGVSVLLNYNASTTNFASTTTYTLTSNAAPTDLAVADFDGDSIKDIAVSCAGLNFVFILPGNGSGGVWGGGFNAPLNFVVGTAPQALVVADFNGDGKPDIISANNGNGSVSVLLNSSAAPGSFNFNQSPFSVITAPTSMIAGDFNGDTKPDIAVINNSSIATYTNNGAGVFAVQTASMAISSPSGITIGDYNGDAKPDLAVSSSSSYNAYVMINSGTSFGAPTAYGAPASVNYLEGITSGDFDMNGTLDIAVMGYGTSSGLFILPGTGTGTFGAATLSLSFTTAGNPIPLIRGDYNLDGLQDVAFPLSGSNNANISINAKPLISGPNAVCAGGTITLTANGAGTYTWNPGSITTNTISITPSSTTTYTVIGTSGSCSASAVKIVTVNALPVLNPVANPSVICAYSSSTLSATGAVSYTWSPAPILNTTSGAVVVATPTAAFVTYSVIGTDANGCVSSSFSGESPQLTTNPVPTVTLTSTTPASCFNGCDGQAVINIGGGGPISVAATSGTWTPSYTSNGSGICAGPQTVTVTAAYGCTAIQTLTITSPPAISITFNPIATSCGLANGSISAIVNGGTPSYTYSWTPISSTVANISNLSAGTYTLNVTDNHGCIKSSSTIVNSSVNTASISINEASPMVCVGSSTVLTTTGNVTTYTWSTGANTSSVSVSPSTTTSYTVTGTDATGCVNIATTTVIVNSLPFVSPGADQSICAGSIATYTASGANTYTWSTGATTP
ncbi:MAG TPA: VCBS repeat-containing protein, partial [Bacteroidia bacterium]|nr:VCBS repeat-containing protein [Bacteroidia bacterium]